jgi:hypothetical protein
MPPFLRTLCERQIIVKKWSCFRVAGVGWLGLTQCGGRGGAEAQFFAGPHRPGHRPDHRNRDSGTGGNSLMAHHENDLHCACEYYAHPHADTPFNNPECHGDLSFSADGRDHRVRTAVPAGQHITLALAVSGARGGGLLARMSRTNAWSCRPKGIVSLFLCKSYHAAYTQITS